MEEAPEALAMATVKSPTGPHPSTATERPDEVLLARGEDRVAERLLQRRDLRRQLLAVRLPDHGLRHRYVAREGTVTVDAQDLRALAEVAVAGAARGAGAAGDVALGRDEVADGHVADVGAHLDDRARKLMT